MKGTRRCLCCAEHRPRHWAAAAGGGRKVVFLEPITGRDGKQNKHTCFASKERDEVLPHP